VDDNFKNIWLVLSYFLVGIF